MKIAIAVIFLTIATFALAFLGEEHFSFDDMIAFNHSNAKIFDVTKYGAAGDGILDDTDSIARAIEDCKAGGVVYFPAGFYKITASLIVPRSFAKDNTTWCSFKGDGMDVSLLINHAVSNVSIPAILVENQGFRMSDMGILQGTGGGRNDGIYVTNEANRNYFYRLRIYVLGNAFHLHSCHSQFIIECIGTQPNYLEAVPGAQGSLSWNGWNLAFVFLDLVGGGNFANQIIIDKCTSENNYAYQVYVNANGTIGVVDNLVVTNSGLETTNPYSGIFHLVNVKGGRIVGNYFEGQNNKPRFYLERCRKMVIQNYWESKSNFSVPSTADEIIRLINCTNIKIYGSGESVWLQGTAENIILDGLFGAIYDQSTSPHAISGRFDPNGMTGLPIASGFSIDQGMPTYKIYNTIDISNVNLLPYVKVGTEIVQYNTSKTTWTCVKSSVVNVVNGTGNNINGSRPFISAVTASTKRYDFRITIHKSIESKLYYITEAYYDGNWMVFRDDTWLHSVPFWVRARNTIKTFTFIYPFFLYFDENAQYFEGDQWTITITPSVFLNNTSESVTL